MTGVLETDDRQLASWRLPGILESGMGNWRYVFRWTPPKGGRVVEPIPIFEHLRCNRNCVASYHRPTLRCLCRDPGRPKCSANRNIK
jgi:hypothetical protein